MNKTEMNKEAIEHRERLKILEKNISKYYYMIGNIHIGISDAMEEYHQAKLKLLGIADVVVPKGTLCRCECEMPDINGRQGLCGRCERPIIA